MTRVFQVADITAAGEVRAVQDYEYALLERLEGASDLITLFSTWLWRSPERFEVMLPGGRLHVRWRASAHTAGIASLYTGNHLFALSIFLSGQDREADSITSDALQKHLVRELHDTGFEPAFDLQSLVKRPMVATLSLKPPAEPRDRPCFALWDRCFAASYFRKQGIA